MNIFKIFALESDEELDTEDEKKEYYRLRENNFNYQLSKKESQYRTLMDIKKNKIIHQYFYKDIANIIIYYIDLMILHRKHIYLIIRELNSVDELFLLKKYNDLIHSIDDRTKEEKSILFERLI